MEDQVENQIESKQDGGLTKAFTSNPKPIYPAGSGEIQCHAGKCNNEAYLQTPTAHKSRLLRPTWGSSSSVCGN